MSNKRTSARQVATRRVIDFDNHTVREEPILPPGFRLDMSPEAIAYRAECAAEPDDPTPPPVILDINGFDPNEFEWRPVPRRRRTDGWSPEVQCAFIQALADTGLVERAALEVNMSVQSAYRLRNAPGSEGFSRAWSAALAAAAQRVLDLAFQRAIEGEETPILDNDGCRIGSRRKVNDRMVMCILRAYMPERFRHAHQDVRQVNEAPPPALPSVADAVAALAPVTPPDPHLLMDRERLEHMVDGARAVGDCLADLAEDADREPYVYPRPEADHPAAIARRLARRKRAHARTDPDEDVIEAGWTDAHGFDEADE